ncbi:MAG: type II toxin-antitoxin system PemK/MazF family toxin [Bacilli bacterium]|nr:type II toxin-antitoxin system PemK/MazF family toxin [Bacilli bacterium]
MKKKYEVGDIVFVSKYSYDGGEKGQNHLFVIIDVEDNQLVPVEYFGLIVSSHIEKAKETGKPIFKFNEKLNKNSKNNLNKDSIVKCDQIYQIPEKNIQFKIGQVDIDDYIRFMEAYNEFLSTLSNSLAEI